MTSTSTAPDAERASRFVPTVEMARLGCLPLDPDGDAPVLPAGEPTAVRRLAAIVLAARVIRRESRDEDVEMSLARASYLLPEMPPTPTAYDEQSYLVRVAGNQGPERACTACDVRRPGHVSCHNCGGSGWIVGAASPCPACVQGFILCSTCDGSTRALDLRIRFVNDVYVELRDVFVPEAFRYIPALFSVPVKLREMLADVVPPIELATPLFAASRSSAYRDAVRKEPDPMFLGHRFEDALEAARGALRSLVKPKSEIVLHDVRSFAWPFLWVEHGAGASKRHAVYVVRPDGQLAGQAGEDP